MKPNYEIDDVSFPTDAYTAKGWSGIAWIVYGWETEPDQDTEWTGYENLTGRVVARMVGDNRMFTFEPDDLTPINDLDYCSECGQIGCAHDGRSR